jgi:hypothetical protein
MTILRHEKYAVPTTWAMFTDAGNRRVAELARELVVRLDRIHAHDFGGDTYTSGRLRQPEEGRASYIVGKGPHTAEMQANKDFFLAWHRLEDDAGFEEAGDTEVREAVFAFAVKVAGYSENCWRQDVVEAFQSAGLEAAGMTSETFSDVVI